MALITVAGMFGIAGRRDELVTLMRRLEAAAVVEPGCRRYTFASSVADPMRFLVVSEWEDQAALDAHYASDAFREFQFGLQGLLARPSEMTVYTAVAAVRPANPGVMDPRDAD